MKNIHIKNKDSGDSSGGPVVKAVLPTQGCREWFLVDKLRSNMPGQHSQKKNIYIYIYQDSTPPFLGRQCWYSFDDKTPFPGQGCTDSLSSCWSGLFHSSWDLERMYPWLIWCSLFWQDINCTEHHASLDLFPRAIWDAVFWAIVLSLAQIKLFFSYCRSCTDCFHHR